MARGPVCPRCGVMDEAYRLRCRPGQYTCRACRHRFSVTSGTALHRTHLPLRTWLLAMYLIATSSKDVSARKLTGALPADQRPKRKQGRGTDKPCVFVAVARGGRVVPHLVASHSAAVLGAAVRATVDPSATVLTDELPAYVGVGVGRMYARHARVQHSADEFVRRDPTGLAVHVNTAESWNATLKRAIVGVFHSVSHKHLPRYAAESAFRWNERRGLLDRVAVFFRTTTPPLPYRGLVA